jgi:uncharacterized protein with HEPN domain
MVRAVEDVRAAVAGLDLDAFVANRILHKAVIRDLEVLGEAARSVPDEVRALCPAIPWRRIVGMRNKLIHAYFGVDLATVFVAATEDVPPLAEPLRQLLARLDRER